ncbi:hypothetical protein EIN_057040 [Entamoeba invadens IP1]|uniref:hypothetical protein n=1 Tax=Entamoeba invadens IP1 TaxID=370355 RepID=UPI0002C3E5CF|nr:hypothetical protein EIN_057040 [Entamoeba invadens IP1]ELP93319.1 hypothetical protein EIN_057040 [Entamoeba invadens IP1]|eukprot:XP_004260090.1 hypothetical protein EIN_057040 [Entamoeba invadens IP1]
MSESCCVFLAFQEKTSSIICDDIYDAMVTFGPINRIIRMNSNSSEQVQSLVEFTDRMTCEKAIEYLKVNPLPVLKCTVRAEIGNATRLNIHTDTAHARDYTTNPRYPSEPKTASRQSTNRNINMEEYKTKVLMVHDLPKNLVPETAYHLYNMFSLFGSISKVNVLSSKDTAMVEFETYQQAHKALEILEEVKFFGSILKMKHSKNDNVAAPSGTWCKVFKVTAPFMESTPPSVFVRFVGLHPIIALSPNLIFAICHYFDHYAAPRPVDAFFDTQTTGVFAFKSTNEAIMAICILNHKKENGTELLLSFVASPPNVARENVRVMNQGLITPVGQPMPPPPQPPQQMFYQNPPQQQYKYDDKGRDGYQYHNNYKA